MKIFIFTTSSISRTHKHSAGQVLFLWIPKRWQMLFLFPLLSLKKLQRYCDVQGVGELKCSTTFVDDS